MRFTVRRLMIAVAVVAVPLGILAAIGRELDRFASPRDPVVWAKREAAYHAAQPRGPDGFGTPVTTYHQDSEKQYAELARQFKARGVTWGESTPYGPFTDVLAAGEKVVAQIDARAFTPGDENPWAIPAQTACEIIEDGANDSDACSTFRSIQVRILEGSHAGKLASIERVYLRRKP